MMSARSNTITAIMLFSFLSLSPGIAAATAPEGALPENRDAQPPANPVQCEPAQTELFSCRLESGRTALLCIEPESPALVFRLGSPDTQVLSLVISDAEQVVDGRGGTVVRGRSERGAINFCLDRNNTESPHSAIFFNFSPILTDQCIRSTVSMPVHLVKIHGKEVSADIFGASLVGLTHLVEWPKLDSTQEETKRFLAFWRACPGRK